MAKVVEQKAADTPIPFTWPEHCRAHMPLVEPRLDEPVWGTQRRWEIARSAINKQIDWCSDYAKKRDSVVNPGAR